MKIYFVEPRIMENVEAALVHDGWTVALGRGERSGPRQHRIATHLSQPFDQGGGRSDLIGKVRHSRISFSFFPFGERF